MDWETLQKQVQQAEHHIAIGETHIARTRQKIEELIRAGEDTVQAEKLLRTLEAFQAVHLTERDRLKRELKALTH